jgi:hypothetical protein
MAIRTWHPNPLSVIIVELMERKGATTDTDLYDMVKELQDDVAFSELNRELMRLEIGGKIHMSALTKGKRRVELRKPKEDRG